MTAPKLSKKPKVKIIIDPELLDDQVQIAHITAELYVILQNLKMSEPTLLVRHDEKDHLANEFATPILADHIVSELIQSYEDGKSIPQLTH